MNPYPSVSFQETQSKTHIHSEMPPLYAVPALQAPPQKPPLCWSQGCHRSRQSRGQEPCPPHLQNGTITAPKRHDGFVGSIGGVPVHKVLSAAVTLGRSLLLCAVTKYSHAHSNLFSPPASRFDPSADESRFPGIPVLPHLSGRMGPWEMLVAARLRSRKAGRMVGAGGLGRHSFRSSAKSKPKGGFSWTPGEREGLYLKASWPHQLACSWSRPHIIRNEEAAGETPSHVPTEVSRPHHSSLRAQQG